MTKQNDDDAIAKGAGAALQRFFWPIVAGLMSAGIGWVTAINTEAGAMRRDVDGLTQRVSKIGDMEARLTKVECRLQMEACR